MENVSVKVEFVSKEFPLTEWDYMTSIWRIIQGKPSGLSDHQKKVAVRDISFSAASGERIGIIGRNGAGKTTLLQMIAGLAEPSQGRIEVEGKVTCVMALGVGLREELTGRENILRDGEISGRGFSEIQQALQAIMDFADLGVFMDHPVRTYSTGMKSRLAFAMMTHIYPEILMIDEALSTGDAEFSKKAAGKIKEICQRGKIVFLVSHSMASIREMCSRCLWIEGGRLRMDGDPFEVTQMYLEFIREKGEEFMRRRNANQRLPAFSSPEAEMITLELLDAGETSRTFFECHEKIKIRTEFQFHQAIPDCEIHLRLKRLDGLLILERVSSEDGFFMKTDSGKKRVEISLESFSLGKSDYELQLKLLEKGKSSNRVLAEKSICFRIENLVYPYENPVIWQTADWNLAVQNESRMVL